MAATAPAPRPSTRSHPLALFSRAWRRARSPRALRLPAPMASRAARRHASSVAPRAFVSVQHGTVRLGLRVCVYCSAYQRTTVYVYVDYKQTDHRCAQARTAQPSLLVLPTVSLVVSLRSTKCRLSLNDRKRRKCAPARSAQPARTRMHPTTRKSRTPATRATRSGRLTRHCPAVAD